MKKTPYERKKLTYKKCLKRYALFENILVGGSCWNKDNVHRYAKASANIIRINRTNVRTLKEKAKTAYEMYDFNLVKEN